MSEKSIRIGLVGFGVVGSGVAKILLEDAGFIEAKTGIKLELATIVDLDTTTERPVKLPKGLHDERAQGRRQGPHIVRGAERHCRRDHSRDVPGPAGSRR